MFVSPGYGLGATDPILTASGGAAAATGGLIALAPGMALAGPIGAAVGAVLALLGILGVGSGCGQSCIAASNDANAIEVALKANLQAFLSGQIDQATALANFQALWLQLQQACAQIGGDAGKNCIADRQQGACHYQTSPGGWQQGSDGAWQYIAAGPNGSGTTCWNWDVGYREAIASAPSGFGQSSAGSLSRGNLTGGNFPSSLIWAGVGLLLAEVL